MIGGNSLWDKVERSSQRDLKYVTLDALNTQPNQANYHKLSKVLASPPLDAKCNMLIMRACKVDVVGQS